MKLAGPTKLVDFISTVYLHALLLKQGVFCMYFVDILQVLPEIYKCILDVGTNAYQCILDVGTTVAF